MMFPLGVRAQVVAAVSFWKKPPGHWVHAPVAPSTLENLPALHGLHPDGSATPFADEYVPAGHLRHVELSFARTVLLQVPFSHDTHSVPP